MKRLSKWIARIKKPVLFVTLIVIILCSITISILGLGLIPSANKVTFTTASFQANSVDPLSYLQWNLNGPYGINKNKITEVSHAGEVIVAMIDSGFMLSHEDLKESIWTNRKEIPGNNIDEDNNGYVDDVNGFDFDNNKAIQDNWNAHGTWTSGVVAATTGNNKGIAGICDNCKIMPLKVAMETYETPEDFAVIEDKLIKAFTYAENNGAKVINCSWSIPIYSQKLQSKITQLYIKDILVVAAAGNSNQEISISDKLGFYPAQMRNVLTVGAINEDGTKSEVSNYGTALDVSAPSSSIPLISPYRGEPKYSIPLSWLYSGDAYVKESDTGGTSLAAPHVSAVAAIIFSRYPKASSFQVMNAITSASRKHLAGVVKMGKGTLDASKSLDYMQRYYPINL